MADKEQIIIDGVNVYGCVQFIQEEEDCCNLGGSCKGWPNCYYKQLIRKIEECEQKEKELLSNEKIINKLMKEVDELKQECEKLEDFRTLTRWVFTFGDSDVDDENFIKYLQEYSRSYEEAIDGYYRLTDITGIDNTVHGCVDIEEIIKRVDILKHECEELKKKLLTKMKRLKN